MADASKRDLTKGSIHMALVAMSAPMSFGIFAVIAVGLADAYFLGKVSGAALAAVGFIYPVITAITSLSIGISAGANATLSQHIGSGAAEEEVQRLGLHSIVLGLALSVITAALIWVSFPVLFSALGASGDVADEIAAYMPLWTASFPFLVTMMITNSVFRSHGDGATSAAIMVVAAFFGVALNPVLIFGVGPIPELSTAGAALATLIGRVVAMVIALWLAWRRGLLGGGEKVYEGLRGSVAKVLDVGIPASLSNAINPAGMALVTAAVATVGDAAVALSAGIGPVVGQNWGAEQYDRARLATRQAFAFCLSYGLLVGAVLVVFANPIASLLASGDDDLSFAASYLRIVGLSMFGYGIIVVSNAAMNARSKALWSLTLSLGRIALIYLPFAWLGVMAMGYNGVLLAAVAANVLGALVAMIFTFKTGLLVAKGLGPWPKGWTALKA